MLLDRLLDRPGAGPPGLYARCAVDHDPWVFDDLGLHRLEAACLPENEPSRTLLAQCGFTEEGYARQYLRINGAWRDHVLFALLQSDARPTSGQ